MSSTYTSQTFYSTDKGQYIVQDIDDYTKCQLLENPWLPKKDYSFPYSEHIKGGKQIRHYVGHQHLGASK